MKQRIRSWLRRFNWLDVASVLSAQGGGDDADASTSKLAYPTYNEAAVVR